MKTWLPTVLALSICAGGVAKESTSTDATPQESTSRVPAPDRFTGFTEPVRQIDVAIGEAGRIARVHVRRGTLVEAGDLLLELELSALEPLRRIADVKSKLEARLKALNIEERLRRNRHEKLLELQAAGAGSLEEVKRAEADAEVARLEVVAEEDARKLSRLELEEIEARIESRRVRSPIDGTVTEVLKDVGEFVAVTEPEVVRVVELETLRVTYHVPTRVASGLADGKTVLLEFPGTKQTTTGTIEYVGRTTEAESGRVRVDVLIDNTDRRFRSGVRCEWAVVNRAATRRDLSRQ